MRRQATSLYRFAFMNKAEKERLEQKINSGDMMKQSKYRFNLAALDARMPNFSEHLQDPAYLEKSQIETRILKRLYNSELVDIKKFKFSHGLKEDLHLDSLNIVVLLTEIEHEFTTVFEDRVFDSVRNLQEIVDILARDQKIF